MGSNKSNKGEEHHLTNYGFLNEPLQGKSVPIPVPADNSDEDLSNLSNLSNLDESYIDSDSETLSPSPYISSALRVTSFILDFSNEEISFKPTMAHQIFDQEEIIQGYKNLKVMIRILPNSYNMKLKISFERTWDNDSHGYFADNIPEKFQDWFPHLINTDEYELLAASEDPTKMFGTVLTEFTQMSQNGNSKLYINVCNGNNADFIAFHKRFQALIVFFIDAASIIDFDDNNWTYIYIYKEHKRENKKWILPIGFCTVYHYQTTLKARISQFFILPPFQHQGFGTRLLGTVYKYFQNKTGVKYITVESPGENFVVMRDKMDLRLISKLPEFSDVNILGGFSDRMKEVARLTCKMSPEQTKHIFTILLYYYSRDSPLLNTRLMSIVKKNIHTAYRRKLSRFPRYSNDRIRQLKKVVEDDYLTNRIIAKEAKAFLRSIKPQVTYLTRYMSE